MKKFLLLYSSYSDVDCELFTDCLGVYNTFEEAKEAMIQSQEEDDEYDGMERDYVIKEMKI